MRNFSFCEGEDNSSTRSKICNKLKWIITVSRNSLVLIVSSIIAYVIVDIYDMQNTVYITGEVKPGIPSWDLPWHFGLNNTQEAKGPFELAEDFGIGLVMLPLVSMIQVIAIVHNFSRKSSLMHVVLLPLRTLRR